MNSKESADYTVGKIAALSMYVSLLFLMLQVPVWIAGMVVFVLAENGIIPKSQANLFSAGVLILAEVILIWRIVVHVRKKYLPLELYEQDGQGRVKPFIFKEQYLERLFNLIACVGILWVLLLGMNVESVRYLLIVTQGFAMLFFMIFLIVRLILTKTFAFRTLLSIVLSAASIWLAIRTSR